MNYGYKITPTRRDEPHSSYGDCVTKKMTKAEIDGFEDKWKLGQMIKYSYLDNWGRMKK